jgi:hypothetical protein
MITEFRRRRSARQQRAELERVLRQADRRGRDELVVIAQRQGLIQ